MPVLFAQVFFVFSFIVSGEILYVIITLGYNDWKSTTAKLLCNPKIGSLTKAPLNLLFYLASIVAPTGIFGIILF